MCPEFRAKTVVIGEEAEMYDAAAVSCASAAVGRLKTVVGIYYIARVRVYVCV